MGSIDRKLISFAIAGLIVALMIGVYLGYSIRGIKALEEVETPVTPVQTPVEELEAKEVRVKMRVFQFGFDPAVIEVEEGSRVIIEVVEVSSEKEPEFKYHTFTLAEFGVNQVLEAGKTYTIEFVADKPGEYTFECAIYCGVGHAEMKGKLVVRPKEAKPVELLPIDFLNLEAVNSTLKVLVPEEELPDQPVGWSLDDYKYLVVVVQREHPEGAIKVINMRTLEVIGEIAGLGKRVHVIEVNPAEPRWIYSMSRDGYLSKIDIYTMKVVRQIRVGTDSRGLALSEDGKYIAAGNYAPSSLVILDAYSLVPLKIIKSHGVNPDGESLDSRVAGIASARGFFVVSNKELGQAWLIEARPPFRIVGVFTVGRILHEANVLTQDERYVSIVSQKDNTLTIIDVVEGRVVKVMPTPLIPHPGQSTHDFKYGFWYSNSVKEANITVIDLNTLQLVGYIWPEGIEVKAGGGLFSTPIPPGNPDVPYIIFDIVFGPHNGTLIIVDREMVAKGLLGPAPVVGLITWKDLGLEGPGKIIHPEYSYDGKYLIVSAWDHNKIIIIDARALPDVVVVKVIEAVTPTGIFPLWRVELPWLG